MKGVKEKRGTRPGAYVYKKKRQGEKKGGKLSQVRARHGSIGGKREQESSWEAF